MKIRNVVGLLAATIAWMVAAADVGKPPWPGLIGDPVVGPEWYTDIPWVQKLGTFNGNRINQAIVLPYEVLTESSKKVCEILKYDETQCMIAVGVTNIIATQRTDTRYDPKDPKISSVQYCQDPTLPCVEVMLQLSFWSAEAVKPLPVQGGGRILTELDYITLKKQTFGKEPPAAADDYGGYVFSASSTYGPQMPWYMSHYCDSKFPGDADAQDPVCYADYLSEMNNMFNGNTKGGWPKGAAFSVWPTDPAPAPNNHCASNLDTCTLVIAGFKLAEVPDLGDPAFTYKKYNQLLFDWFNRALTKFPGDVTPAELERHFPWSGKAVTWAEFVHPQSKANPFVGTFTPTDKLPGVPDGCDVTFNGTVDANGAPGPCTNTGNQFADTFVYPRQCSLNDLAAAASAAPGDRTAVTRLRSCSLNYELHSNGFISQWSKYESEYQAAAMRGNQYGRTTFLFSGVPGIQLPASFLKPKDAKGEETALSIFEQVYNASIFSMYLPVANVADMKNAMDKRNYTATEFYHTLLMSNHNESDPESFANGIRGKVLWHNEYRMQGMWEAYANKSEELFRPRMFAAAFNPATAKSPWHNNTCDSCHVRNGSGIPTNTEGKLDKALQEFMQGDVYKIQADYTFTGTVRPMKLVFFDLKRDAKQLDASRYSEPLSTAGTQGPRKDLYYQNKIMNFHGDSFHVTTPGNSYTWTYEDAKLDRMVVKDTRAANLSDDPKAPKTKVYTPQQVKLNAFQTASPCQLVTPAPPQTQWPANCNEVDGNAITAAIARGEVGFMHLNGKRLGNLSVIEAIPSETIIQFQKDQRDSILNNKTAGEIIWNKGSRDGVGDGGEVRECRSKSATNCYIGRFGWIGDRVSLEDQVANAAFVEMNLTTSGGYKKLYKDYPKGDAPFPIRYLKPNCGPADKACTESKGNGDLTELEVERMADYARWLGNPTRSELKVALPEVIAGEQHFREAKCDTCHVIKKIEIVPKDTMLTKNFRERLATRVAAAKRDAPGAAPFLTYIGTDLLMHDMGYLSQVAAAPIGADGKPEPIRNEKKGDDDYGVVKRGYENFVQKIRTPALKGLGLNRFVTDSYQNTKTYTEGGPLDAACDFLLHDGRACDAIEAAFMHDGPAVARLGVITTLNGFSAQKIRELRAFLYSL